MTGNEYQQKANNTAAEPDDAVKERLVHCAKSIVFLMNRVLIYGDTLDKIKKFAFYNRQNGVGTMNPEPLTEAANQRLRDNAELLHAVIGIITEVSELSDALLKHVLDGKDLDAVNVMEELGDLDWYKVLALKAVGYTNEQCQDRNIEKLEARYKGKFNETAANNRDLDTERKILEDVQSTQDANT